MIAAQSDRVLVVSHNLQVYDADPARQDYVPSCPHVSAVV